MCCWSSASLCLVQEAEQEEVKVIADTQPPRSAKKGKASASSTPQTGSDKKERKGKHKGLPVLRQTEWRIDWDEMNGQARKTDWLKRGCGQKRTMKKNFFLAKIVYCYIVLCLYLFMLKHQKKKRADLSHKSSPESERKETKSLLSSSCSCLFKPSSQSHIMGCLPVFQATSGNKHSQWSCPLSHCYGAILVRAQLSIMMPDSVSAVSLMTHHK